MFSLFEGKLVLNADSAPPPALMGGEIDVRKCRGI